MTDHAALLARFLEIRRAVSRAVSKGSGEARGREYSRVEAMRAELRSRDGLREAGTRRSMRLGKPDESPRTPPPEEPTPKF